MFASVPTVGLLLGLKTIPVAFQKLVHRDHKKPNSRRFGLIMTGAFYFLLDPYSDSVILLGKASLQVFCLVLSHDCLNRKLRVMDKSPNKWKRP